MNRRPVLFLGLGLAAILVWPVGILAEDLVGDGDKTQTIYSVLEASDSDGRVEYWIVPSVQVPQVMRAREKRFMDAEKAWRELPSADRQSVSAPKRIKITTKKTGLLGWDKADAERKKLLDKVPENRRGIADDSGRKGGDQAKEDRRRYAAIEVLDEQKKISCVILPEDEAQDWMAQRRQKSDAMLAEWKKLPSEDRKKQPEPQKVRLTLKKNAIDGLEAAETWKKRYLASVPKDQLSEDEARAEKERKGDRPEKPIKKEKEKEKVKGKELFD
jgi:hypothetical protein